MTRERTVAIAAGVAFAVGKRMTLLTCHETLPQLRDGFAPGTGNNLLA